MRRRILLLVVGVTVLVVLAFAIPLGILIRSAVAQRVEDGALDKAGAAAQFLRSGPQTDAAIAKYVQSQAKDEDHRTWIVKPDGITIGAPPAAQSGDSLPPPPRGGPNGGPQGGQFGAPRPELHAAYGGRVAQAVATNSDGTYRVFVFVSKDALHDGEYEWWLLLVFGSVGLLVVGIIGGELVTRRIVRPLEDSARTAHRISAGDVSARAPTNGPREVAEVGAALNQLADRIDELIREERETVADLSHRLRTPLTALRLDAEALQNSSEAERIGDDVAAMERTLTAVIRAARRPQREGRVPVCDATAVVGERVRFWSALTEEQRRELTLTLPTQPVTVRSSAEDLAAAVDALVENVIAHTDEGAPLTVLLRATDDGALLEVGDGGPGLPTGVGERGRSDRGSSGLGLDIARRCATASGGSMATGRSDLGGALVALHLGAP